jgi:hypothetical protein
MNNPKYITALFLAVMLVPALGCASSAKEENSHA